MDWFSELITGSSIAHAVLVLSGTVALGVLLSRIKICGVSLGVTWILFVGIVAGALLYSNGNLELMLNTMLYNENGGMIYKLADSWNVGILVFLVILGIMVALMNKVGGSAA
ncbi:MAG: hypothetical protein IKB26_01750, partial [Bacteroidales bacterium]|nr:hypothetical protein [Bacteroidales bacterium]